jgi:filamentous hemagglutinin family protein
MLAPSGTVAMHPRFRNLVLTTSALLALGLAPAAAGPEGGTVVGGAAAIQGQGGAAVIINQSTPSAIINWNTFNIRAGESVRFNQPSSSSVALNRVTGGLGPSQIMGTLTANGRIFLVNRDGILFGPGAVVNTAGFLATTNDIRNADFMAGKYNFNIPGRPDASIVNKGTITATSGGFAALVAPGVRNSGTITATLGTVALASGNSFTLDMYGDKLITLAVGDQVASKVIDVASGRPLKSLVSNTRNGTLSANGGRVELTAAAARAVVDSVINTRGVIRADSIGHRNGMIVLAAATGASKPAGAPAQTIKISGTLSAAGKDPGTKGGTIIASGEHIKLRRALVDASGHSVGGKVMIGGDWGGGNPNKSLIKNQSANLEDYAIATATTVSVDRRTKINASASESGNGGKVILWSDSQTTFAGTILARGGAQGGDGGFVEVSSHQLLNYSGTTDTRAPKGSVGTLLLDPENLYINANGLPPRSDPTASAISENTLVNQLASSNVMLSTLQSGTNAGDILVDANISWKTDNSLTLSAYHDITFMSGSKVTNTGAGNLVLRADNTGRGQGTVVFNPGGHVDYTQSTGTVSLFYNPTGSQTTKYQKPTNYFCPPCPGGGGIFVQQASQLTAYMLVNTTSDLDAVRTNQSGTYALGTKITFDPNQTFTPIPNFTGLFDGQGQVIANLTITSTTQNVGLFGTIANPGEVRNLNLANVSVSADSSVNSQLAGTVAGINAGTIINVSATGQVQAGNGSIAGGLVGQNLGTIKGTTLPALTQPCVAGQSCASVEIRVGSNGMGGGLVGSNSGTITNAFATGDVTGAAGTGGVTTLGGLAAVNLGFISNTFSSGDVGSLNVANLQASGLVGNNAGTISSSVAVGNVQAGDASIAGGLVASNSVSGAITGSRATGNITVGAASVAGGLVAASAGTITDATALGVVNSTGANSTVGGLVGANEGTITDASASGAVTSTGASSTVGGLVGANEGTITDASASGTVASIGAGSTIGGLVGANQGTITDATASGAVTSTGASSTIGGLVGANQGTITGSTASGAVTSTGANSTVGGLFGVNQGTITGSTASGVVTSTGANSIVGDFVGANFGIIPGGTAPNSPTFPSIVANLPTLPVPSLQPLAAFLPEFLASLPAQTQIINNLVQNVQLVALNTAGNPPLVNNIQGGINLPPQPPVPTPTPGTAAGRQILPGLDRRIIDIPPPGETRMIADEVVVQIATNVGPDRLRAAVRRLGLEVVASETLTSTGSTAVRLRITNGRTPAQAIQSLANVGMAAIAQPNYVYALQQQSGDPAPSALGETGRQGDPAQYILEKLKISDVHRLVKGTNILIAVIDSEIDAGHPDLGGVIAKHFSAVGTTEKPHAHGTGMAGAIASHDRLLGTAPASRLLAVHAFSTSTTTAESTTFNILKGVDWSVNQSARIINMSFAGPKDPSLERALKLAYDRGIVLIAAAGNAGPKSPPLFPGAVPYVIAVTATDVDDKLFAGANRGKYVSVAAPGVDILVPAPESSYQVTTGTSVAAAEVSGIVALLLERNPKLTPADIRRILTSSAKRLGPGDRDENFGSGLVDPLKALQLAIPRTATTTPPPNPTQQ